MEFLWLVARNKDSILICVVLNLQQDMPLNLTIVYCNCWKSVNETFLLNNIYDDL